MLCGDLPGVGGIGTCVPFAGRMARTKITKHPREPRELILAMTERQVIRLGHEKTRVVDVAKLAGMSHANVYRFFNSRQHLMEELAARSLGQAEEALVQALKGSGAASKRIERGVLALMRHNRRQRTEAGGVDRVVSLLLAGAGETATQHFSNLREQFARVIAEGQLNSEFQPGSPQALAQAVLDATMVFYHPSLSGAAESRMIVRRAKTVVSVLLSGMQPPA